ncbi:MAG: ABC transporter substrate-binding protein [Pseudomonadota bacterium]
MHSFAKSARLPRFAFAAALSCASLTAQAQIRIGVTISSTGPAASLGIPEKNAIAMLPKEIAGHKVEYIILDDASDTTQTVTNTRKLISEEKVDAIIGSTTTPNSLAMLPVLGEGKTAAISLASSNRIIEPMDANRAWMFKTPQTDTMMAIAIAEDMSRAGVKSMGFIGFSDALGEAFLAEVSKYAELKKIRVAAVERYSRNDSSVVGQVLKLMSANPDAIVVGASGTPAALPPKTLAERGYKGRVYHNHGVANSDFMRVCGKDCESTFLPTGPVMVARQLPDANPVKKAALDFSGKYETANGAGSLAAFASYAWDAGLLLQNAIPVALKHARPGTAEFRSALRDALENIKGLPTTNGVVNMNKNDHLGLDQRARVMVQIKDGKWKYFSD